MKNQNIVFLMVGLLIGTCATYFYQSGSKTTIPPIPPVSKDGIKPILETGYAYLGDCEHHTGKDERDNKRCYTFQKRDTLIKQYNPKREGDYSATTSIISTKQVNDLFNQSEDKTKILVKVTNIRNPANVKIEWLPWTNSIINTVSTDTVYLYEFPRDRFDQGSLLPYGMIKLIDSVSIKCEDCNTSKSCYEKREANGIAAKIGKDAKGKYYLFINAIYFGLLNQDKSKGGQHGADAGIHIPPQSN